MRRFFSAIHRFFASLFTPAGQEKITIALGQAESLVQAVMPVVETIAAARKAIPLRSATDGKPKQHRIRIPEFLSQTKRHRRLGTAHQSL